MIETLNLQNFKVLRDVEVKLRPLTVIVGPNGSGKSSILEALSLVMNSAASPDGVSVFKEGASRLCSREAQSPCTLACAGTFAERDFSFEVAFSSIAILSHDVEWGGGEKTPGWLDRLRRAMGGAIALDLDVRELAAPAYPTNTTLSLPPNGEGLSALLSSLALEDPMRFEQLVQQLREVVPGVEGIRFQRVPVAERVGFQLYFDMKGAPGIPANAISEGTLLTLGLLAVLAVPDPPNLLLLDDFERGLHPVAQADLVKQLRAIQENRPDLQIVATSHSPHLLDSFAAEEVLLTALGDDGYAIIKPLTDHPEYERWKDFMDTGEFWSTVGEGWVTKKQPRSAA